MVRGKSEFKDSLDLSQSVVALIIIATNIQENRNNLEIKKLRTKAAILDELVEFIEDKYLGYLMSITEEERNISLSKARKLLRA